MSFTESGLFLGVTRNLAFYDESTFGVKPGSPTYFHVPADEYNCKWKPVNRQARSLVGLKTHKHNQNYKGVVQGSLTTRLYGWYPPSLGASLANYLLTWAYAEQTNILLPSKGIEVGEGPNVSNKRHHGMRVNSATLSGSDDTGFIALGLDLMGQFEEGQSVVTSAQSLPNNRNKLVDFEYCGNPNNADSTNDTLFYLDQGSGNTQIYPKSFSLKIDNALKPEYLGSGVASTIPSTDCNMTLELVVPKQSDVWDAFNRALIMEEFVSNFVFQGLHNGSGSGGTAWNQVSIAMPRLSFMGATDSYGMDLQFGTLKFVVLKPDTSAAALALAFADIA
jgi:hypothetical protein